MKRFSTLTAASKTTVVDLVCRNLNYQATVDGAPNPETKQQFVLRLQDEWPVAVAVAQRNVDAQKVAATDADL
jgi:hypothetical protein